MGVNHTIGSIFSPLLLPAITSPIFTLNLVVLEIVGMSFFFRLKHFDAFGLTLHRKLELTWISGLVLGSLVSILSVDSFGSPIRVASFGSVSIVSLFAVTMLPLIFSAFAVYICRLGLLLPVAFAKAFCFSFSAATFDICFGPAGWLAQSFLLFCSGATLPVLWWYWNRSIRSQKSGAFFQFGISGIAAIIVSAVDYWLIAPYWIDLIS